MCDQCDPFDLIFLAIPGYFLLQATLTLGTSGRWRKATLVPAAIMVPVLAYTVLAFAAQSNLWPLLLLLSAPLACLYLVVLGIILLLARIARARDRRIRPAGSSGTLAISGPGRGPRHAAERRRSFMSPDRAS